MPDIKTRDVVKGTVKVIDKSAVAAERMKDAYVRTKDKAEHGIFAAESSPEEYAADRTLTGTETAAHEAVHGLDKASRKGVKTTKENISKAKDYFQRRKTNLPKKQAQNAMQRVRRSADTTQKTIKTVDRSGRQNCGADCPCGGKSDCGRHQGGGQSCRCRRQSHHCRNKGADRRYCCRWLDRRCRDYCRLPDRVDRRFVLRYFLFR